MFSDPIFSALQVFLAVSNIAVLATAAVVLTTIRAERRGARQSKS